MPRILATLILGVAGVVSLPLSAYFLDGEGSENFILPAQLGGMAVLGGLVGWGTPALGGGDKPANKRIAIGMLVGLLTAVVGVVVFFLLLNGFDGA